MRIFRIGGFKQKHTKPVHETKNLRENAKETKALLKQKTEAHKKTKVKIKKIQTLYLLKRHDSRCFTLIRT